MPGLQRKRVYESARAPVVRGHVAFELFQFLSIRPGNGVPHHVARKPVGTPVHQVGLSPVLRRQELQVESRTSFQFFREGVVQVNRDFHPFSFCRDNHARFKTVVFVAQDGFDGLCLPVDCPGGNCRHQVPLLRRIGEPHGTALRRPDAMVNEFNTGCFLIVKPPGKQVAVYQYVNTLCLEIFQIVQGEVLGLGLGLIECRK